MKEKAKKIVIIGSTGSIGQQTLDVISAFPSSFKLIGIAAHSNAEILEKQTAVFKPRFIYTSNQKSLEHLQGKIPSTTEILSQKEAFIQQVISKQVDMVVIAVPGVEYLDVAIEAAKAQKTILLATKEVLVTAGEIFMKIVKENKVALLPIDSEHNSIYQLIGEEKDKVAKLILTASGGPFLNFTKEKLEKVTAKDALKHPTWKMGQKITIDSATMMNKGLEIIEAHYLFDMPYDKIHALIHPQSIIHALVEFIDGSTKALLSFPDMKIPIQFALFGMKRQANHWSRLDFSKDMSLTLKKVDSNQFPAVKLAYEAGKKGKTYPAVLNAANEVAVKEFLTGKINFTKIVTKIEKTLESHTSSQNELSLEMILEADRWARENCKNLV